MVTVSIILFAIAAVLGLIIIAAILQDKKTPKAAVYAHGLVAATALIILIIFAFQHKDNVPMMSILLFVVAALGGFVLFGRDIAQKAGPKWLALLHALLAVAGFLSLLVFAFA